MTANHEHTPTWDRVREHYYLGRQQFDDPLFPAGGVTEIVAEFDRWYQAEIAAAEQRGAVRAFKESANEVRRELRWQYEQNINRNSDAGDSIDRLLELEKVFKYRADQEGDDD